MTLDISQVLYASTLDTLKNVEPDITGTVTVPSQSYAAAQTRTFTSTQTLDRTDMSIQAQIELSIDSSKKHITRTTIDFATYFVTTFNYYIVGDAITVMLVVWNADGVSSHTCPGFTADYTIKQFAAPFD